MDAYHDDRWLVRDTCVDSVTAGLDIETGWILSASPSRPIYLLHTADRPEGAPPSLREVLRAQLSERYDGFVLSQHGLPALRAKLAGWLAADEGWPSGALYVSVAWTGTGPALFDICRMVAQRQRSSPAVLVPQPGWNYEARVRDAGMEPVSYHVPVTHPHGPERSALLAAVEESRRRGLDVAAVIINPQHNPSGSNWTRTFFEACAELSDDTGAVVIVDNAFFGMTANWVAPSSAVPHLASLARAGRLAYVRSLSKQFGCNGWSLGAVAAAESLIDEFADRWRGSREDPAGFRLQAAMAGWLDTAASVAFARQRREEVTHNAARLVSAMSNAGIDVEDVACHGGAPFGLVRLSGSTDPTSLRRRLFERSGVLTGQVRGAPWLKVYLGRAEGVFARAMAALEEAIPAAWRAPG